MKVRLVSSIAVACYLVSPWQWLAAVEEMKYPSPDGKFALRITKPTGAGWGKIALIEKASGEVTIDLGEPWRSQVLVWSPDSKRLAYANRGDKWGEVKVYLWNGSTFEEATLPDNLPTPHIKFPKDCGAVKNYGGAATPLRWLTSGDLELSSDLMMLCRGSGATCTGELRFTLAFDAQHHASVTKVGKTKTEVEE